MTKGLSSVKTLTAREIAKKWELPLAVVAKKIAAGVKVEKEHTKSTRQANEIARDHIGERPDYYEKLDTMEKKPVVKEEIGISGVRGLGYVTGDPSGTNYVEKYVNSNSMSYNDQNGDCLKFIEKHHKKLHNGKLGFKEFDPRKVKTSTNKDLAESLGSDYGTSASPVIGDLTGSPRKVMPSDVKEDLRKWFREKWVRYDTKGNIKGPCAREEGEGKPKCRPLASARAMSKDERAKSAKRKRREDPVADRSGKGGKPIMVRTEETLMEKNVPTNPALWARAKAQAKAKFDVYPSAYANGWASKWYKSKGGGWKSAANESIEEACWDTHKQEGMKKKGGRMVPNCVPKEEKNLVPANTTERGIYEMRKASRNPAGAMAIRRSANAHSEPDAISKSHPNWRGFHMTPEKAEAEKARRIAADKASAERWAAKDRENGVKEETQIDEISAELVGKVSNARWRRGESASKTLSRAINKKFIESGKKKEDDTPFEGSRKRSHEKSLTHVRRLAVNAMKQYQKEETTMDTKELVNEALDNILEENLTAMKDNLMQALQEKAMEKLEERKKIIASDYFAQ